MFTPPSTSQKNEMAHDASSSSSPLLSLHVPSPEHGWTAAELARTSGISAVAAGSIPLASRWCGLDGGGLVLPSVTASLPFASVPSHPALSLLTVLPTPSPSVPHSPQLKDEEESAVPQKLALQHKRSDSPVTAPRHAVLSTSLPCISISGATAEERGDIGGAPDASSSSPVPQFQGSSESHPPPAKSAHSTPLASASDAKRDVIDSITSVSNVLAPAPSPFTDLFVGLEPPRLHHRWRRMGRQHYRGRHPDEGVGSSCADASASSLSPPSSPSSPTSQECSRSSWQDADGPSADDEAEGSTEDEDGAHTPSVYRHMDLPHWWRSVVTPVTGTRVYLRPDTCRLEFWWIDRLGGEAYELIRVILRHALEGVVLRKSGETTVAVEFRIPSKYLRSTSYAVRGESQGQAKKEEEVAAAAASAGRPDVHSQHTPIAVCLIPSSTPSSSAAAAAPGEEAQTTLAERTASSALSTGSGVLDASTITLGHGAPNATSGNRSNMEVVVAAQPPETRPELPRVVGADSSRLDCVEPAVAVTTTIINNNTTVTDAGVAPSCMSSPPRFGLPLPHAAGTSSNGVESTSSQLPQLTDISAPTPAPTPISSIYPSLSLAGRSFDVSVEQGQQRRALARVLDTNTMKPQLPPQLPRAQLSPKGDKVLSLEPATMEEKRKSHDISTAQEARARHSTPSDAAFKSSESPEGSAPASIFSPRQGPPQGTPLKTSVIHDTSIMERKDDVGSADQTASAVAQRKSGVAPHLPLPTRQSLPLCYRLPVTVNVHSAASHGGVGASHSHPSNTTTDGAGGGGGGGVREVTDTHLYDISLDDGAFLVHVEAHPRCPEHGAHPQSAAPYAISTSHLPPNVPPRYGHHRDPGLSNSGNKADSPSDRRSHPADPWPHPKQQQHPLSNPVISTVVGAMPPNCGEMARVKDVVGAVAAVVDASQQTVAVEDDHVLTILSLPGSVCIPVVVWRLHAMHLLHPLLHTLSATTPDDENHRGGGSSSTTSDEQVNDSKRAALPTKQHASSTASSTWKEETTRPNYLSAIRMFTTAIASLKEKQCVSAAATTVQLGRRLAVRARDLSILYTIRSHLLFHASAAYLDDSLRDAEEALRCCPARDHLNNTYEILAANLISFGYNAQVEKLAGYVRHHWRLGSPLLFRLGRVVQVLMSYAASFMRQQLVPSTAHMGRITSVVSPDNDPAKRRDGSSTIVAPQSPRCLVVAKRALKDGVPTSPDGDPTHPLHIFASAGEGNLTDASGERRPPRVALASGSPNLPVTQVNDRHTPRAEARATPGSLTAIADLLHLNLSCEVCPLLMGRNVRHLRTANASNKLPLPLLSSPTQGPDAKTGVSSQSPLSLARQKPFRPSEGLCHRRLFLLETLFPSMTPTPLSRLKSVLPLSSTTSPSGLLQRRSLPLTNCSSSGKGPEDFGSDGGAPSHAVIVHGAETEHRTELEDFLYDRETMLSLLAVTADYSMNWGTMPMRYFCRHIRLSSTRRISKGETVLMERPALLMPLWPLSPPRQQAISSPLGTATRHSGCSISGGGHEASISAAPPCCAQCGRQRLSKYIKCPGGCDTLYCSEQCRDVALRRYHIMECRCAPPSARGPYVHEQSDGVRARVCRAVAAVRDILMDWNAYLYYLAHREPSNRRVHAGMTTRPTVRATAGALSEHGTPTPVEEPDKTSVNSGNLKKGGKTSPPIVELTAMRAVGRLVAMLLAMVIPTELLPPIQNHASWIVERHVMIRAVALTLRERRLMVSASASDTTTPPERCAANLYCTHVDPCRLLLMEVMLQELSVPFFADFNYRVPTTVWERMGKIPGEVLRDTAAAAASDSSPHTHSTEKSIDPSLHSHVPLDTGTPTPSGPKQMRSSVGELTSGQREEMFCELHHILVCISKVLSTELTGVFSLPVEDGEAEDEMNGLAYGLPGQWDCVELLSFLGGTRPFQQICDFCLTSWAVVYPRDVEPAKITTGIATSSHTVSINPSSITGDERSPAHHPHHRLNNSSTITNEFSTVNRVEKAHATAATATAVAAVPLAVMSPWACLTVDLYPILGSAPGAVIYSRFMVEHEQRRRMLAFCAAAANCRRGGGGVSGAGGNDDSFLSIHSATSMSVATRHSIDDSARMGSMREDRNLQLLEEAARRSCSNIHLSIVYASSNEPIVVVTAKKNIGLGDVLLWESLDCSEYLRGVLSSS